MKKKSKPLNLVKLTTGDLNQDWHRPKRAHTRGAPQKAVEAADRRSALILAPAALEGNRR